MSQFNFLPENYEAPRTSGFYMKLQQGENRIRILSQPLLGWEDWNLEDKPVRFAFDNKPEKSIRSDRPVRHFWAFIVWNYNESQIQVLHITQAGIRKGLEALCKDSDWGAPFFYDIKIIKEGEELKTKYLVNPLPHKPVSPQVIQAYKERPCLLDALLHNEDPFSSQWKKFTPGIFSGDQMQVKQEELAPIKSTITSDQAQELQILLDECDPVYKKSVMDTLARAPINVLDIPYLPSAYYDKIKVAALKKKVEYQNANENLNWMNA